VDKVAHYAVQAGSARTGERGLSPSDVANVGEMPASGVDDKNSLLDLPLMGRSILELMTFGGVPREGCASNSFTLGYWL
jgi:hypothetical protein